MTPRASQDVYYSTKIDIPESDPHPANIPDTT